MPLYGDILQENFFDLKNSINCQINGDLEPFFLFTFFNLILDAPRIGLVI